MSDGSVGVIDQAEAGQSFTKAVDTAEVSDRDIPGNETLKQRQRMVLADPVDSDGQARVRDGALMTGDQITQMLLRELIDEVRMLRIAVLGV